MAKQANIYCKPEYWFYKWVKLPRNSLLLFSLSLSLNIDSVPTNYFRKRKIFHVYLAWPSCLVQCRSAKGGVPKMPKMAAIGSPFWFFLNLKIHYFVLPISCKQGLRWTRKLRQCTIWKVRFWMCKVAKASSIENWSVQLVCLADPFSWSV